MLDFEPMAPHMAHATACLLVAFAAMTGCGGADETGVEGRAGPPSRTELTESTAAGVRGLRTVEVLSPVFHVLQKYGSMQGPAHQQVVNLL